MGKIKTTRNYILDAYRGFTMISMILYHSCYDYFVVFNKGRDFLSSRACFLWQQSICISFILLSGMVWEYGRKNALKRGIILNLLGFVITFVTLFAMPEEAIFFGILNFMGCVVLFMIPISKLVDMIIGRSTTASAESDASNNKNAKYIAGIIICLIIFMITKRFPNGYIGSRYHSLIPLPDSLYRYQAFVPFGFPPKDFRSSDYFPIIPWLFMYITGYFLGKLLNKSASFTKLGETRIPFFSWLGTKSLLIYVLHQPVCFAIVWLICR